ncbi:hypothetical protein [Croceitalea vernalis]|uniref:DUF3857 domain-containing protein n=1 Tax=Croceitalea vernalis TaxID=3075599 RepID=A0ABU3BJH4_9FLAO|nr:hypothetical protein [Croceitalea sp. P007]MDT0622301.1 hypothetical protein [Croceitalea sp. P007]
MRIFLALSFILAPLIFNGQYNFDKVTQSEIDLKVYEKDTTANAVVLTEKGEYKFQVIEQRIFLIKNYSVKIKILKEKGFEQANIEIPLYHNDSSKEIAYDIKGITHNGIVKSVLSQKDIFKEDTSENWSITKLTMPNIQVNSVIQYSYKIKTPFFFNLDGWDFQSDIPKIYSEFNAEIPGTYYYNRSLYGSLPLSIKDVSIKNNCFRPSIIAREVNCEVIKYAMKDIPAFDKKEKYMLAAENYIARLDFELATHYQLDGTKKEYSKTWKSVDSEFKKDKDIGRQLGKSLFFTKQFEENNLQGNSDLETANNIFNFVKKHFRWNGKYGIYKNIRVKEAFNEKVGNIGEINISLINMLNAADIKTNLMLISTRQNGLPKKSQPVITDFNYVIAKTEIGGKTYLLDASDKINSFGFLPFRCLNHYGRVMDFKEDSYWYDIVPQNKNKVVIRGNATLNPELGEITGKIREINQGYNAIAKYKTLKSKTEPEYLDDIEGSTSSEFFIDDYKLEKERSTDKLVMQSYDFSIENALKDGAIYLNPILIKFFAKNPFLRESRNFPIDFGYPYSYEYNLTIKIPEEYKLISLPENKAIALPNNHGILDFKCLEKNGQLNVRFLFQLKNYYFDSENYEALQAFFNEAVIIQKNSLVNIQKI